MQKLCGMVFVVVVMFGAINVALKITNFVSQTQKVKV